MLSLEMQDILGRPPSPKRHNDYRCYKSAQEAPKLISDSKLSTASQTDRFYCIISAIESTTLREPLEF